MNRFLGFVKKIITLDFLNHEINENLPLTENDIETVYSPPISPNKFFATKQFDCSHLIELEKLTEKPIKDCESHGNLCDKTDSEINDLV
jgi:hypothetical protein